METTLQYIPYIRYSIEFQNNKVQAFINSSSKVNVMIPLYTVKLGLNTQKTSVQA